MALSQNVRQFLSKLYNFLEGPSSSTGVRTLRDVLGLFMDLYEVPAVTPDPSAGGRGDLIVFGAFKERRVAGTHLEWSFAGDVGGTAAARPSLWVEELARMVGAVTEARTVETGVTRLVDLCCVPLQEQVDGHDTSALQRRTHRLTSVRVWLYFTVSVTLQL